MLKITSVGEGYSFWRGLFDKKSLLIFSAILLIIAVFWYFNPLVVTVTGTGEVSAVPEKAKISYLVTDTGATVGDAISKVGVKQNSIRSKISSDFGIADSSITQSQVSVIPPSLAQGLNQYAASISAEVELSDYGKVSSLLTSLYAEGASYVSQPVLMVKDTRVLEDQAYRLAVRDADKKAASIGRRHLKFLKRKVAVSVAVSSPESVNTKREVLEGSQQDPQNPVVSDSFKMTSLVTVTYKMW